MIRGKVVKTTVDDQAQPCLLDRVNRQFQAERPNALWVSDFTYVSTWQGMVYMFDVYARHVVSRKASGLMTTDFVLDALEQLTIGNKSVRPKRPDSTQTTSKKVGRVQLRVVAPRA